MKQWQTALVAILPISILFLAMNIVPEIENSLINKGIINAVEEFVELDSYNYQLDYSLKFGREEAAYRVSEQVSIKQLDPMHKRQYHKVMLLPIDDEREAITIQYMTDTSELTGVLVNHSTMPGWYEVNMNTIATFNYEFPELLKESLVFNIDTAVYIDEFNQLEAYRVYQPDFQNETWFQEASENEQKLILNIHEFRAQTYYMDILVNKEKDQIESIRLENSAIGDYLSVVNGHVKYYLGSIESINLNYVVHSIKATDETFKLPAYTPMKDE